MGETEFDPAHLLEAGQLALGQRDVGGQGDETYVAARWESLSGLVTA
jgi:hypothetical protein